MGVSIPSQAPQHRAPDLGRNSYITFSVKFCPSRKYNSLLDIQVPSKRVNSQNFFVTTHSGLLYREGRPDQSHMRRALICISREVNLYSEPLSILQMPFYEVEHSPSYSISLGVNNISTIWTPSYPNLQSFYSAEQSAALVGCRGLDRLKGCQ